jgi:hypothetical protein
MDESQKANLAAAARISEITLRWTRTQLFFLIHSALFSLVLTQFKLGSIHCTLSCILGLWLAVLWFLLTRRSQYLVEHWNRVLASLEDFRQDPVRVFVNEERRAFLPGVPVHTILMLLVGTFILVWSLLFVVSFVLWLM